MVGLEGFVLRCRGGGIAEELDRGVEIAAQIVKLSGIAKDIRIVGSDGAELFKTGNSGRNIAALHRLFGRCLQRTDLAGNVRRFAGTLRHFGCHCYIL